VKHALLASETSLAWLRRGRRARGRDAGTGERGREGKHRVQERRVEKDEREAGTRAVLNLGHTTAHALEVSEGYGRMSHGRRSPWVC